MFSNVLVAFSKTNLRRKVTHPVVIINKNQIYSMMMLSIDTPTLNSMYRIHTIAILIRHSLNNNNSKRKNNLRRLREMHGIISITLRLKVEIQQICYSPTVMKTMGILT